MVNIPIAIVGAGGMGGRHLRALGALYESGMANVELVAVCDTREENAIHLADNAEEMASNNNKAADLVNQMMNAGAIQMEADGSISLTGPGGPTNIMGNAE